LGGEHDGTAGDLIQQGKRGSEGVNDTITNSHAHIGDAERVVFGGFAMLRAMKEEKEPQPGHVEGCLTLGGFGEEGVPAWSRREMGMG